MGNNQATRARSLAGAFVRTNGAVMPDAFEVVVNQLSGPADQCFFTANYPCKVVAVKEVHSAAGTDGSAVSLQVTKDTSTNAPGAGTDLLTNNTNVGFDMKGTANTVQTGALVAEATRTLAVGDRLSLDYAGTLTTLAGVQVTVSIQRLTADA